MGILYSNVPLTKETSQETILQMFITEEGTLNIKDTTINTYNNVYLLRRDIDFVKNGNEFTVKLTEPTFNNGTTIGMFIAEGHDFSFQTKSDPIFLMKKKQVDFNLKQYYDPKKAINEFVFGVFTVGTIIKYKIDGVPYTNKLLESGWEIKKTESVSDVAQNNSASFLDTDETTAKEKVELAKHLMEQGEISKSLFERYKTLRLGYNNKKVNLLLNTITLEEVKKLKEKGL